MTIQELIDFLEKQPDKTLQVVVEQYDKEKDEYWYGWFNEFTICEGYIPNGKPKELIISLS